MSISVHLRTTILPGSRVEVSSPELPQGHSASVFIVVDDNTPAIKQRLNDVLAQSNARPAFRSAEEVEAYLKAERDSWER